MGLRDRIKGLFNRNKEKTEQVVESPYKKGIEYLTAEVDKIVSLTNKFNDIIQKLKTGEERGSARDMLSKMKFNRSLIQGQYIKESGVPESEIPPEIKDKIAHIDSVISQNESIAYAIDNLNDKRGYVNEKFDKYNELNSARKATLTEMAEIKNQLRNENLSAAKREELIQKYNNISSEFLFEGTSKIEDAHGYVLSARKMLQERSKNEPELVELSQEVTDKIREEGFERDIYEIKKDYVFTEIDVEEFNYDRYISIVGHLGTYDNPVSERRQSNVVQSAVNDVHIIDRFVSKLKECRILDSDQIENAIAGLKQKRFKLLNVYAEYEVKKQKEEAAADAKRENVADASVVEKKVDESVVAEAAVEAPAVEEKVEEKVVSEPVTPENPEPVAKPVEKTEPKKEHTLSEYMQAYAANYKNYYSKDKWVNNNTKNLHDEETRNKQRKINAQMKSLIGKQLKKEVGVSNVQKDFVEGLNLNETSPVNTTDLEDLAKNDAAVMKLFQIASSGVYTDGGKRVRLTTTQRLRLSEVLVNVSELRITNENRLAQENAKANQNAQQNNLEGDGLENGQ